MLLEVKMVVTLWRRGVTGRRVWGDSVLFLDLGVGYAYVFSFWKLIKGDPQYVYRSVCVLYFFGKMLNRTKTNEKTNMEDDFSGNSFYFILKWYLSKLLS